MEVVGVELSPLAIQSFFEENNLQYNKERLGDFNLWQAKDRPITLLEGDIFLFDSTNYGKVELLKKSPFDFVYDRASLIALPPKIRKNYYDLYKSLMGNKSKALLLTIEYESANFEGPPFSVKEKEVISSLQSIFNINLLGHEKVKPLSPRFLKSGLKEISQKAYRIEKREQS